MGKIRGCELPEDLYYYAEKHVWAKPMGGSLIRVGMNTVAGKLSGGKLNAVTVRAKNIGAEIAAGKSVATVESSKYVGPVPAPVAGVLKRANEKLTADPNLAITDPYGEGWIVELESPNWETDKAGLLAGPDGLAAYKAKLEADGISCE
ncbi:MAG: glycine cleavage system protein H [Acidobacteriota bacterium]|nr:glycine cleavage system protein H [Acidobacteriota bacterium]